MVARLVRIEKVRGSIPLSSTEFQQVRAVALSRQVDLPATRACTRGATWTGCPCVVGPLTSELGHLCIEDGGLLLQFVVSQFDSAGAFEQRHS